MTLITSLWWTRTQSGNSVRKDVSSAWTLGSTDAGSHADSCLGTACKLPPSTAQDDHGELPKPSNRRSSRCGFSTGTGPNLSHRLFSQPYLSTGPDYLFVVQGSQCLHAARFSIQKKTLKFQDKQYKLPL